MLNICRKALSTTRAYWCWSKRHHLRIRNPSREPPPFRDGLWFIVWFTKLFEEFMETDAVFRITWNDKNQRSWTQGTGTYRDQNGSNLALSKLKSRVYRKSTRFQYVSIIIFPQLNDTGGKSCPCFPFKWPNVGPVMIHFPMNLPSGYLT